ncbi:MAG: hypothetical protein GY943_16615, partial [Chloroflexi bacterium]|nr:hypothetical protein [Chloroflexota bacterium]
TWLTFDITDDALIIENDGVFRAVDFERLQNLAGGGKRDEAGTTGAFGIGFIAVYQITDAPEILSNNTHWIIHPDAPAEQRIQERPAETHGTRFYLPWAFNGRSPIRRALRMEAVVPDQLDDFATSFGEAIELAVLFLTQLKTLTVMRNGRLLKQIERIQPQPDQIVLKDETGQQKKWILIQGDFDTEAAQLRHTYTWQIEAKRRSQVRVAVPTEALDRQGRLFAVLPTNDVTPLPFHINADFYPTTDRKRIHFDTGYQAKWNQAAIACAAKMVAEQIGHWQTVLGHVGFWQLLQKMTYTKQMAEENELADVFALFWQMVAPSLRDLPVLYTANQKWILPREGRLFMHRGDETAVSILTQLQIPIVHPDLTSYHQLMRLPELNTPSLIIDDIAAALMQLKLTKSTDLFTAPPFLRTLDQLKTLWQIIDKLLTRLFAPQENESALQALRPCAIVLTEQMTLERLDRVFQSKPEAKQLFPQVHWLHTAVSPTSFPGNKVQNFGVRQAVELLQEMPIDQLEHSWRMGQLDLPALFRWFESQQIEIFADDPLLQAEIRRLPLCPVGGELRPLTDLYIPGGFDDPLGLAGLLDLDAIGGRSQFLQDLGARELDFDTYVSIQMPHMLAQQLDIPS